MTGSALTKIRSHRGPGLAALAVLLAAPAWSPASPARSQPAPAAEELTWRGPLRVRSQFPLDLVTLDLVPDAGLLRAPDTWTLEVGLVRANTIEITDGYADRVDKFESGDFEPGYDFVFDDETTRLHVRVDHAINRRFQWGFEVPMLIHDEGFMDSFINDFHEALGLPDNGRSAEPEDQFEIDLISGAGRFHATESDSAFGDVVLRAKVLLHEGDWSAFSFQLEAKAPTGDEESFAGTGDWDFGGTFLVSAGGRRNVFHGGLAYHVIGDAELLPIDLDNRVAAFGGWEWAGDAWSVVAQAMIATSVLPDDATRKNDREHVDVAIGAHHSRGPWTLSFGILENVTTNDNAADFGFFVLSRWSL